MLIQVGGSVRTTVKTPNGKRVVVWMDSVLVNELEGAELEFSTVDDASDTSDTSDANPPTVFLQVDKPSQGTWMIAAEGRDGLVNVSARAGLATGRSCQVGDILRVPAGKVGSWTLRFGVKADSCRLNLRRL